MAMTNLIIEPEGPVQLVPGSPVHRHGEEDEEFPERDHPGVFRVEDEEDVVDDAFRIHAARKNLTNSYYSSVVTLAQALSMSRAPLRVHVSQADGQLL